MKNKIINLTKKHPTWQKLFLSLEKSNKIKSIGELEYVFSLITKYKDVLKNIITIEYVKELSSKDDNFLELTQDYINEILKKHEKEVFFKSIKTKKYRDLITRTVEKELTKLIDSDIPIKKIKEGVLNKIARFKTPEELLETIARFKEENDNWTKSAIEKKIVENNLNAEYLGKKEQYDVFLVNDYEASKILGSSSWCISYSKKYFKNYSKHNRMFFLYDFEKDSIDKESLIGLTVNAAGKVIYAHNKSDECCLYKNKLEFDRLKEEDLFNIYWSKNIFTLFEIMSVLDSTYNLNIIIDEVVEQIRLNNTRNKEYDLFIYAIEKGATNIISYLFKSKMDVKGLVEHFDGLKNKEYEEIYEMIYDYSSRSKKKNNKELWGYDVNYKNFIDKILKIDNDILNEILKASSVGQFKKDLYLAAHSLGLDKTELIYNSFKDEKSLKEDLFNHCLKTRQLSKAKFLLTELDVTYKHWTQVLNSSSRNKEIITMLLERTSVKVLERLNLDNLIEKKVFNVEELNIIEKNKIKVPFDLYCKAQKNITYKRQDENSDHVAQINRELGSFVVRPKVYKKTKKDIAKEECFLEKIKKSNPIDLAININEIFQTAFRLRQSEVMAYILDELPLGFNINNHIEEITSLDLMPIDFFIDNNHLAWNDKIQHKVLRNKELMEKVVNKKEVLLLDGYMHDGIMSVIQKSEHYKEYAYSEFAIERAILNNDIEKVKIALSKNNLDYSLIISKKVDRNLKYINSETIYNLFKLSLIDKKEKYIDKIASYLFSKDKINFLQEIKKLSIPIEKIKSESINGKDYETNHIFSELILNGYQDIIDKKDLIEFIDATSINKAKKLFRAALLASNDYLCDLLIENNKIIEGSINIKEVESIIINKKYNSYINIIKRSPECYIYDEDGYISEGYGSYAEYISGYRERKTRERIRETDLKRHKFYQDKVIKKNEEETKEESEEINNINNMNKAVMGISGVLISLFFLIFLSMNSII